MHPKEEVLNEIVDGTLAAAERTEAERHLESCSECRTIVNELRGLRRAIGSLELLDPPVRAWSRIERAIQLQQADMGARGVGDGARGVRPNDLNPRNALTGLTRSRYVWLGVAAAAVIAVAAAVTLPLARLGSRPGAPVPRDVISETASGTDAAQSVEAELRQASEHYEKAIKGLEQIANAEQGALDPRTATTLQKNLAVIDQAITESRAALHTQPNSEPAQQSLIDNFKTKIELLQNTVALINEMRKGNEAGAARIVSGLKQKG